MPSTTEVGIGAPRPFSPRSVVRLLQDVVQSPQFWDGIKVFGIGAAIAGSKWVAESVWESFKSLVLARAVFRGEDDTYQWVMHYLTQSGSWSAKARDVEILCRPGLSAYESSASEDGNGGEAGFKGRRSNASGGALGLPKGVNMFPLESTSLHFVFHGTHVFAVRNRKLVGDSQWEETLNLSFLTLSSSVIRKFIAVAKQSYDENQRGKVQIYSTDRYNYWSRSKTITKRLSDSVHLPADIKDTLLRDASHFIQEDTKLWYSDRGIPFRRGFLFYGPPGSGKTSLAHVLASELELPIYQCNLNGRGMDDSKFQELMSSIPSGVIVLLEDVDAAFASRTAANDSSAESTHKKGTSTPSSMSGPNGGSSTPIMAAMGMGSGFAPSSNISFSSLLNAIDGIGASDSRILIMTTNHRQVLDEALIRPGRIDLQFEFKNADRQQMRELFVRWFAPPPNASKPIGHSRRIEQKHSSSAAANSSAEKESKTSANIEAGADEAKQKTTRGVGPYSLSSAPTAEVNSGAELFAQSVPEYSCSVAALQGYLLTCGGQSPTQAAQGVQRWLQNQIS
ncbi:unnamed protein product [Sympodiomycopsis kandeliae]